MSPPKHFLQVLPYVKKAHPSFFSSMNFQKTAIFERQSYSVYLKGSYRESERERKRVMDLLLQPGMAEVSGAGSVGAKSQELLQDFPCTCRRSNT